jgi:DNA-binding response OmpR family regulator
MTSVLVVDDDAHIREVARFALARAGYTVELANDGAIALDRVHRGGVDLVVLDVLMPELDGFALCRRLQGRVPIVFLSSRGEEADRVLGLDLGADDYLAKPFSPRELVARIRALLRRVERRPAPAGDAIVVGPLAIDRGARRVHVDGAEVHLTPTEFDLLALLAGRPGIVFSREQLLAEVWGWRDGSGQRTVDSHVRGLRRKLGSDLVRTVHGVGYALETPW